MAATAALGAAGSLQSLLLGKAAQEAGGGILSMLTAAFFATLVGLCGLTGWMLSSRLRRDQLRIIRGLQARALLTRWEVALAVVAGVFVATAQAGLVPRLGVALFTLAFVTGQAVTGLAADATGLGGGPQRHLSLSRVLAVALAVFGVALTSTSAEGRPATPGGHAVLGLAVVVGAALATQQAANGRLARATNAPAAVALVNFVLGLIATFLVLLALTTAGGQPWPQPERWWPYAGGLIGAAVVAVTAAAVPRLGVLTVAIALISGQVVGALAIDVAATSALPTLASTGGAALVLGGVALALR